MGKVEHRVAATDAGAPIIVTARMRFHDNYGASVNYEPNSFGGPDEDRRFSGDALGNPVSFYLTGGEAYDRLVLTTSCLICRLTH